MSPVADINECEEQTSVCPENFECLNVPGSFTCSGLLRPFDLIFDLIWINGALLVLSSVDPEASPLAAASVVGAVMVVFGGAATLLLLVFCYRRYDRLLTTRSVL